jgi:hypothetical protein
MSTNHRRRNRNAEAISKPLARNAQMHLALAPRHDLVRLRIVHHRQRGILLDQLVQRLAELDVVLALLGGDRKRQHRRQGLHLQEIGMGPSQPALGMVDAQRGAGPRRFSGLAQELKMPRRDRPRSGVMKVELSGFAGSAHARQIDILPPRRCAAFHHVGDAVGAGLHPR